MKKTKDSYRDSSSSLRENSSVNTKELTNTQVGEWAIAVHIKNYSKTSVSFNFEYDVWLGSDYLAYVNPKKMEVS